MAREIIDVGNNAGDSDAILFEMLDYLQSLEPSERTAVISGIVDQNTGKLFVATSRKVVTISQEFDGKTHRLKNRRKTDWNHAEFEVVEFAQEHGVDPKDALFFSTLSACVNDSATRRHPSCTDVVTKSGFSEEYVGKLDRSAATIEAYAQRGLQVVITEDPDLLTVCHGLYQFFNRWVPGTKPEVIQRALDQLPHKRFISASTN